MSHPAFCILTQADYIPALRTGRWSVRTTFPRGTWEREKALSSATHPPTFLYIFGVLKKTQN